MNINAMFLQKFIYEIVVTACALNKNIEYRHIIQAKKKIWSPGISIDDYIILLKTWTLVTILCSAKGYDDFYQKVKLSKNIPSNIFAIVNSIAISWYSDGIVRYAMKNDIQKYQDGIVSLNSYINGFIERKNPYFLQ